MISGVTLKGELLITDSSSEMELQVTPKWIDFMIWTGWKMRNVNSDSRQIMVLLLPERYCCSAFCSLGAILAGSTIAHNTVMWDDFLTFDTGDTIYLIYETEGRMIPGEAVTGDFCENDGLSGRWVKIKTKRKNHSGVSFLINKNNIESYQISKERHASQMKLGKLKKLSRFFSNVVDGYQESWIVSNRVESVIVTNKAVWLRQMEGVNISDCSELSSSLNDKFELSQLLMTGDFEDSPSSHTRIVAAISADEIGEIPLTIMDGVDALVRWESYLKSNIIVLLSRAEYTEEAENILSMLSSFREDDLVQKMDIDVTKIMPGDTEMTLFALPNV